MFHQTIFTGSVHPNLIKSLNYNIEKMYYAAKVNSPFSLGKLTGKITRKASSGAINYEFNARFYYVY